MFMMNRMNFFKAALLSAVVAVMMSSCATSSYLGQFKAAQDAFNSAAEIENRAMADPELAFTQSAEGSYKTARLYAMYAMGDSPENREFKHDKTDLAKDGLLLTAYTIRALSEWKLGMYSEALKTSNACRLSFGNDPDVKNQRDYIVMQVMDALVYNDSIYAYTNSIDKNLAKEEPNSVEKEYLALLKTGLDIVKEQRDILPADHPMQTYLCITQLTIAKNWKDLTSKLRRQMKLKSSASLATYSGDWKNAHKALNAELVEAFASLESSLEGGKQNAIYKKWKNAHIEVRGI